MKTSGSSGYSKERMTYVSKFIGLSLIGKVQSYRHQYSASAQVISWEDRAATSIRLVPRQDREVDEEAQSGARLTYESSE